MSWFVMLVAGGNCPLPLVTGEDGEVALFPTKQAAEEAGNNNPLGEARGFVAYEWPVEVS